MTKGLKILYQETIVPKLKEQFGYKNIHQVPKLVKVSLNRGLGEASQNAKALESFKKSLFNMFERDRAQQLPFGDVKKTMADELGMSEAQVMSAVEAMTEQNKVMLSSDILYLI